MHDFTIGWILWMVWFLIEEGLAIAFHRGEGYTLSEHVWSWFSIDHEGRFWRIRRIALISGMVTLLVHFIFGGKIV